MLYPQNVDSFLTIDSVTSLDPMYRPTDSQGSASGLGKVTAEIRFGIVVASVFGVAMARRHKLV